MLSDRLSASDAREIPAKSPSPILVVDDNAAKRLAIKAVLLPLGYSVVEADSGRAALRCIMAQDFAVILLDVAMPLMDGFETAALIRQRRQSEMTPIIFITAYAIDDIVKADRYAQGAVDFIFAPVPPDELRAKVSVFANLFIKAEGLASRARDVQMSADQLRLLAEIAPIGIFRTDAQNRYVYTNPVWTEITGIPAQDAVGREWDSIIGSEPRGALDRGELGHRFEIRRPGAAPRIVRMTSRSIPDTSDGVAGWVGTLADETAEAGAEAAMSDARDKATEASRFKSNFLANMSHEIRTPMNGVIGMTDLLLETDLDARQRDYAETVRSSGEALLAIVNDILDFSKVEAGRLEIEDIEFNLRTVVDDVVDLLAGPAQAKGLELIAVVEDTVPTVVRGDPGRVRQVLTNLTGNAIKFTPAGEIVVQVVVVNAVGADIVVRFEVSDTGDGISADKLDLIFQPFFQADNSTTRKYGGTGLGLAISGQLVALMGGDCGVSSRPGEGSNFWFTICVHAETAESSDGPSSSDSLLAGVSVLIVDDNATQRRVLSGYLTDWGMKVGTADSGEAALAALRTATNQGRPFNVALLDLSMPGMDGLALTNAIIVDPDLAARLVLMTGLGQERDLGDAVRIGGCETLSKPIHREDLRSCLRVVLGLEERVEAGATMTPHRPSLAGQQGMGRLLLAEDNPVNQQVAAAMLENLGYRVDVVADGAEAVKAAALTPYQAILLDCQMPVLDGYQATSEIRRQQDGSRRTPIIAVTASAMESDQQRCLAAGMDDYLAKPLSLKALAAVLARWAAGGATPPVLDSQVVGRLEKLGEAAGKDLMGQLATLFLADADVRVAALRQALATDDAAAVVRSAHTLSGASANLGATDLARMCAAMATESTAGDLSGGGARLEAVEAELGRVRSALHSPIATP
jgi:two-component system, sensor histidine kinase and response regulator